MDCYSYKVINNCETPILKNVDVVLILAMEDSTRFKEDPFILNLTKQTIIQYNKGFKKCNKPSTIISSKQDIVHAYYTAFEYLKEYNNVIILEDDAFAVNKDLLVYEKIDAFIATTDFDIFTFGSFGLTSKYSKDFFKFDKSPFNLSKLTYICSQANIYSYNARTKLIEDISSTNFNRGQMDSEYLAYLDKVFTYKYPLIVQLFPQTENMKLWCNNIFHLHIVKCIIALFKLDSRTYGWYLIYFICRNFISIITLIIIILIISIHYFKVYNMKLVKTNKFII
jgi:hypothetical protein